MSAAPSVSGQSELRVDIQLLRAWAVSVVVVYHAGIPSTPGGFLGVDVFFVVSGYLMTAIIAKGIALGDFRIQDFLLRRARRLLPASLLTVAVTALVSPWVLGQSELHDLVPQAVGSLTFTANVVLWRQSDYFAGEAELKPLLHMWSLSLEEQYYFLLPALMMIVPRRWWISSAILLVLASLLLCLSAMASHPSAAFYLLPTRAWELGLGSLCALVGAQKWILRFTEPLFWPALFVLVASVVIMPLGPHPGPDALLVCIATAVILLRKYSIESVGPAMAGAVWVGNISYSLYLVHWPVIAFLNNSVVQMEGESLPIHIGLAAIAVSVALAALMYKYVELPGKRLWMKKPKRLVAFAVAGSVLVLLAVLAAPSMRQSRQDWAWVNRPNYGFSKSCDNLSGLSINHQCQTGGQPEVLVWGDSFAMHLVPGILEVLPSAQIAQATKSSCGPFARMARYTPNSGHTLEWAQGCIEFNESVLTLIEKSDSIRVVVISSPFSFLVGARPNANVALADGDRLEVEGASIDIAISAMRETVDRIHRAGKRVVLISPPPHDGRDVARCNERVAEGLPLIGAFGCEVSRSSWQAREAKVQEFIARVASELDVRHISFERHLCESDKCRTAINGVPLYRDYGHLSYQGSIALLTGDVAGEVKELLSKEEVRADP